MGFISDLFNFEKRWREDPAVQSATNSVFDQLIKEGWEGEDEGILYRADIRIRKKFKICQEKSRIAIGDACERWRNTPDILSAAQDIYRLLEDRKWNGKNEELLTQIRNQVQLKHQLIKEKERLACFHATKRWEGKYGGGMSVYAR